MATKTKKKGSSKKSTKKSSKATKARSAKSSKDVLVVDFSDTESRGGKKHQGKKPHYPEGDYLAKVVKHEKGKSSKKKTPYLKVTFKLLEGGSDKITKKTKGKLISDEFYLSDAALWRVRNLVEACGVKVKSDEVKIPLKKLLNAELGITLEDDIFEDDDGNEKVSSAVTDTFNKSELDEVEEDLDAELDDDEDEDEDEEDDEDEEEEDDEEEDEDDEDEDEEEDDDDEDEEDEDLEDVDLDEL